MNDAICKQLKELDLRLENKHTMSAQSDLIAWSGGDQEGISTLAAMTQPLLFPASETAPPPGLKADRTDWWFGRMREEVDRALTPPQSAVAHETCERNSTSGPTNLTAGKP